MKILTTRRRSTSLSDSTSVQSKINKIEGMDIINPDIHIKNKFSIFADCLITERQRENRHQTTNGKYENTISNKNSPNVKHSNVKPLPIYIHRNIDHIKLLDALKYKYKNTFQVKFVSNKLKMMLNNVNDFNEFKSTCKNENLEFHTHTSFEKTTSVVLKGLG